jgi:hypothetical protein
MIADGFRDLLRVDQTLAGSSNGEAVQACAGFGVMLLRLGQMRPVAPPTNSGSNA